MHELRTVDVGYDGQLLLAAAREAINRQFVNRSMVQRHVCVGFAKAARLIDLLESAGVVRRAADAAGAWEVLVPLAEKDRVLRELAAMVEVQKLKAEPTQESHG